MQFVSGLSGSHSGEYEDDCLLENSAAKNSNSF
jgi:hypothetical protein